MRNPVTIPLTKDKTRNLIVDLDNVTSLIDNNIENECLVTFVENGEISVVKSELSASDLYEEICSPSK